MNHRMNFTVMECIPDWPVVGAIGWERARQGYGHRAGNRNQLDATLQITLSGQGNYRVSDLAPWQPIEPGSAILFSTRHTQFGYGAPIGEGEWEFLWISFEGASALAMAEGIVAKHGHVMPFPRNHPLVRRWQSQLGSLGATWGHRALGAAESAQIVGEFLNLLASETAKPSSESSGLVERAVEILGASWSDPPAIQSLAQTLGVSREHLIRAFHAQVGITPGDWIRKHRIRRVADLLLEDNRSIAELAKDTGFATASHLVASFRQAMGETPAVYRRRRAHLVRRKE